MRRNYSLKLDEKEHEFLIKKLDAVVNKSDIFIAALNDHFDKDNLKQSKIDEEIKKEKLTLLKIERAHKVKKIEESHARKRLIDSQRRYIDTFQAPMKPKAIKLLKDQVAPKREPEHQNYIVNRESNYLQCTHCGIIFKYNPESRFDISEAKERIIDHYYEKHGVGLSTIETQVLTSL